VHGLLACQEIERAGAAGLHIDDQVFPKRAHYHKGVGRLVSADEFATRINAAAQARIDPSFLVVARTDSLRVTRSVEQTIERLLLCRQQGADAAMVLDLGPEQAPDLRRALPDLPLIWIGGISEPVPTLTELQQAGFCLATYPFNTVAAVMQATHAAWENFASEGRPKRPAEPTTQWVQRAMSLIGMGRMWAIEERTTERPSAPLAPTQTKQGTSN